MDSTQKLVLPIGLILLVALVLVTFPDKPDFAEYMSTTLSQETPEEDHTPYVIPKISKEMESEMMLSSEIAQGYELAISGEDINADQLSEKMILKRIPPHVVEMYNSDRNFEQHTQFAREALIIQGQKNQPDTLLNLGKSGIKRTFDSTILETESAWGYAIGIATISNEHYTGSVHIFNVVLVNQELRPVSDEITIYWHPSEKQYLATNTFGAPGTFE